MNPYNVVKALYPVKTTAHAGVDVEKLVAEAFPKKYIDWLLFTFDWSDLDGVLDYLYGLRCTPHLDTAAAEIIKLIESNCEVKQ